MLWEPLRVALAWRVTDADEFFVNWVRRDRYFDFDCLSILVDCLWKEMIGYYDEKGFPAASPEGCIVAPREILHRGRDFWGPLHMDGTDLLGPDTITRFGQEFLSDKQTGRFQTLARAYEAERQKSTKLRLKGYLDRRFDQALAETCRLIANSALRARGTGVDGDCELPHGDIPPSAITETMSLRGYGLLYQGPNNSARAWESVSVSWTDWLRCFPCPTTAAKARMASLSSGTNVRNGLSNS